MKLKLKLLYMILESKLRIDGSYGKFEYLKGIRFCLFFSSVSNFSQVWFFIKIEQLWNLDPEINEKSSSKHHKIWKGFGDFLVFL